MFIRDDQVLWSASDLTRATECEFALLRQLDVKLGRIAPDAAPEDPLLVKIAELGNRHEAVELERLRRELGLYDPDSGRGVREVERPRPYSPEALSARQDETLDALKTGADAVYQAAFFDGRFHGFADFVVRDGGAYRVCDAKLARHEQPKALLQLAAYADQLGRLGIALAPEAELLLGNGRRTWWSLDEILPVFRERRARLLSLLDHHVAGDDPVSWGDPEVVACGRCEVCALTVEAHRDLLLVAGMRLTQRRKLHDAGITTIDDLAAHEGAVDHLASGTLATLKAQAALQLQQPDAGDGVPDVMAEIYCLEHLRVLPAPSAGDLFFDFEGDPMWNDGDASDWGLEYLFGVAETPVEPGGNAPFRAFWAHDRAAEKKALEDFVAYVGQRRIEHPDLHIYHYAAYEKSALTRLALRHGTCEDEIDDLLRAGVLVDLYAVVRGAVRVSQPSYSIKKLEPLYMGDDLRTGEVTDAAASIVEYHAFREARENGEEDRAAELLEQIRDYNRYDCDSTLGLRDWLLARAAEHGVVPQSDEPVEAAVSETAAETAALEDALRAGIPDTGRTPDEQALAMLAACVAFNRRELKPFWWAHFDRLSHPVTDWPDQRDVFVADEAVLVGGWERPSPRSRLHRTVRLVGRWGAGSTVSRGDGVKAVFDTPVEDCHDVPVNAVLGCSRSGVKVLSVGTDHDGRDVVVVDEILTKDAAEHDVLPVALVPGDPIRMGKIDGAIREVVDRVLADGRVLRDQPALDIMRGRAPRLTKGALPRTGVPKGDIYEAVRLLDRSYVAVQGPPGTGKTYVGSHVIAKLVLDDGWRVGVVAQGHAVVENMLDAVVTAGVPAGRVVKKRKDGDGLWTAIGDNDHAAFLDDHADGCVIGGTAWDFANEKRIGREQLDLLVIDEAGQFSLAHTVGVSVSARRLLLLGDPQQLPQVSQGTHPEPVNGSALGWLIGEHATLPIERGYFLDLTWRMHPDLCAKDSRLSYDGKLMSKVPQTTDRELAGVAPGVRVVQVHHAGRSIDSPEEAAAVVAQVERLIGTPWTAPDLFKGTRPLADADFLVVAPYNAQVQRIRHALTESGFAGVRVGTVDKFQGQQAAVVIVSMTASAIGDVPRGIDFLLNRNRVNVAISRGQWLSIVIRSGELTQFMPSSPAGLLQLGAFIALCDPA